VAKISRSGGATHAGDVRAEPPAVADGPELFPAEDPPAVVEVADAEPEYVEPAFSVDVVELPADDVDPVSEYETWLRPALRDECERRGLPKNGTNTDIIARLVDYDRQSADGVA
jgi:hypothetical protein